MILAVYVLILFFFDNKMFGPILKIKKIYDVRQPIPINCFEKSFQKPRPGCCSSKLNLRHIRMIIFTQYCDINIKKCNTLFL